MTGEPLRAEVVARVAARYPGRWSQGWARGKIGGDPVYRAVLALLPEAGTLVDLGCGEGYLLALARELRPGLDLVGLDHDPRRLALARAALDGEARVRLRQGTVTVTGVRSPWSVVAVQDAAYGEASALWSAADAAGFCRVFAVGQVLHARAAERGGRP